MTTGFAICLAILSIGSCFACYRLGQADILHKFRRYNERRRRWEEFDDED